MGLSLPEFNRYVLIPTLDLLEPDVQHTPNAQAIVRETIWHESGGLVHIVQLGGGPGRGLGQIEPPTFEWLTKDFLPNKRPAIWQKFGAISAQWPSIPFDEVMWNLRLAVALVRCRYLPDSHGVPSTIEGRAAYWSRVYQTTNDPAKMAQYVEAARRLG